MCEALHKQSIWLADQLQSPKLVNREEFPSISCTPMGGKVSELSSLLTAEMGLLTGPWKQKAFLLNAYFLPGKQKIWNAVVLGVLLLQAC